MHAMYIPYHHACPPHAYTVVLRFSFLACASERPIRQRHIPHLRLVLRAKILERQACSAKAALRPAQTVALRRETLALEAGHHAASERDGRDTVDVMTTV